MIRTLASLAAALLISAAAHANTFLISDDELDADIFPAVAESIRANLHRAAEPRSLSRSEQRQALRSLERLEQWLAEDRPANASRIRAEQIRFNALLAPKVARSGDKSNDVVCQRVRPVGSNIPTTDCRSRAQRDLDRHAAHEQIRRQNPLQSLRD
ncbi:MAG: hypothetical protein KF823_10970 [Xanthomonadales bacterium]|nr:hypothetical protein [Xanthomonadales bacterium]